MQSKLSSRKGVANSVGTIDEDHMDYDVCYNVGNTDAVGVGIDREEDIERMSTVLSMSDEAKELLAMLLYGPADAVEEIYVPALKSAWKKFSRMVQNNANGRAHRYSVIYGGKRSRMPGKEDIERKIRDRVLQEGRSGCILLEIREYLKSVVG